MTVAVIRPAGPAASGTAAIGGEAGGHAPHGPGQDLLAGAEVDPGVPGAPRAEPESGLEGDPAAIEEQVARGVVRADRPAVEPAEVRGLRRAPADHRKVLGQQAPRPRGA